MFTTRWMRQPVWNPWVEMERWNAEMNRLFGDARPEIAPEFPPVNVWTSESGARVTALLPGYLRDDVEVSVVGNTLTLKGEVARDADEGNPTYHRRERAEHKFARTVELPFEVDTESVKASLKQGVLEVELPRSMAQAPRKIAVTA